MTKIEETIKDLKKLFAEQNDLVFAFAGGVGIDGFLNSLTREHDDVDIDTFGKIDRKEGLEKLKQIISSYNPKFNGIYFEFQLNGIKIEIGYVQIVKETENNFSYNAGDGIFNTSRPLFLLGKGQIGELNFDIFNPAYSIVEKIMLPILGKKEYRPKDIQDLNNLMKKIDLAEIQIALFERYKFESGKFVDVGMP